MIKKNREIAFLAVLNFFRVQKIELAQKNFFVKNAFLAVLNFFRDQKLIFGHF